MSLQIKTCRSFYKQISKLQRWHNFKTMCWYIFPMFGWLLDQRSMMRCIKKCFCNHFLCTYLQKLLEIIREVAFAHVTAASHSIQQTIATSMKDLNFMLEKTTLPRLPALGKYSCTIAYTWEVDSIVLLFASVFAQSLNTMKQLKRQQMCFLVGHQHQVVMKVMICTLLDKLQVGT